MAKKYDTPIITLAVKEGEEINKLIEGFESGRAFFKRLGKYEKTFGLGRYENKLENAPNYIINVLFGHKFFHWCNNGNDKVWIKTAPGVPTIIDWSS